LKMVQLMYYHMLWSAMGPIYVTNPKACTQVKSYLGCLYLVLFRMLSFFLPIAHTWLSKTSYILQQKKKDHSEPASTSAPFTRCPLLLSCGWTSFKWVNIWFHLGNQFCRK
jgi:hypothetical protein